MLSTTTKTRRREYFLRILRAFVSSWLLLSCLSACGFSPVYDGGGQALPAFDQIHIDGIPDREGQYLRNALMDRLYRKGQPADPSYTLKLSRIEERKSELDVTKGSDATRAQLRLSTKMRLVERASGKTVLERSLSSTASYNILQSQFTTRVSEQNTRENALDDLARQAETQLALFFGKRG